MKINGIKNWLLLCLAGSVMSSALMISAAVAPAQAPQEKEAAVKSKPPWQRVLQGDDAKRVEALEKQIGDLEKKGQFAEAIAPDREVLAIHLRGQGEDHWETVNARIRVQTDAQVASLAHTDQSALAAALRQQEEAEKLFEEGRYDKATPLLRDAWDACRQVLGEDHPLAAGACQRSGQPPQHATKVYRSSAALSEGAGSRSPQPRRGSP